VVIAILAVIGALSVPFFQSYQVSSELFTLTDEVKRSLRLAQAQSLAGQNYDSWGIFYDDLNKQYILFKGNDFSLRDSEYDLVFEYKEIFNISNDFSDEIYFSAFIGLPSAEGTIVLTSQNNQTQQIIINSLGVINVSQ